MSEETTNQNSPQSQQSLDQRLKDHPELRARIEELLKIIENDDGKIELADEAEERVVDEIQAIGKEALRKWAHRQERRKAHELPKFNPCAQQQHQIKELYWYTRLGTIEIKETLFRHGRRGCIIRPFSISAGVSCRSYSRLLQRIIVDFGADVPFGQLSQKTKEHHGIDVPISSGREITRQHAQRVFENQRLESQLPEGHQAKQVIVEMDGSMIPIVAPREAVCGDRRKNKVLKWEEARLCLARQPGAVSPIFGVTVEGVAEAGDHLLNCAIEAGATTQTQIHGVGDGATWISEQVERQFGAQATYLIDYYHLCEYVAAAGKCFDNPAAWLEAQQQRIKENRIAEVIEEVRPYVEEEKVAGEQSPVRALVRYVENRPGQFKYKEAIEAKLPIGSGEIESGHRYVVQERLKRPGAWWRIKNAASMLALRVLRVNGGWQEYWADKHQAFAA